MFAETQALMAMNSHALTTLEADFVRRLGYLLLRKVDEVAAGALAHPPPLAPEPKPVQPILDPKIGQTVQL